MSAENVAAVRRAWEAWDRRDMEALFAFYEPDVEWDMSGYPNPGLDGVFRGRAGVREFFTRWIASFDDYWARIDEPVDAGDAVLVRVTQGGRGKQSGVEIAMPPFFQLYRLRDGRCFRVEVYADDAEARAAAGLEAA